MTMKKIITITLSLLIGAYSLIADVSIENKGKNIIVSGDNYELTFSEIGILKKIASNDKAIEIKENIPAAFLIDGKLITASEAQFKNTYSSDGKLYFEWTHHKIDFTIIVNPSKKYFDFSSKFTVKEGRVHAIYLPYKVVIDPDEINKVSIASEWPKNMGLALKSPFFKPRKEGDIVMNYKGGNNNGGTAWTSLTGKKIPILKKEISKSLNAGKDAKEWFGNDTTKIIENLGKVCVHRPNVDADIDLLTSENGGFLSGYTFGGKGVLFRIGGEIEEASFARATAFFELRLYEKALQKTAQSGDKNRKKIGILNVTFREDTGRMILGSHYGQFLRHAKNHFIIRNSKMLAEALKSPDTLMIVNPYKDLVMLPEGMDMDSFMKELKSFVKNGGYWIERGGYPFHYEIVPNPWQKIRTGTIGDFSHFDLNKMKFALYSVQPVENKDYKKDIPYGSGNLWLSGCPNGAELNRFFVYNVLKGESFELPQSRIRFGENMIKSAKSFCTDNKITKKLSKKVSQEFLEKFKKAPIIRLGSHELEVLRLGPHTVKIESELVKKLSHPSIIHIFNYLYGGFDWQYPDHLPPRKFYSSAEDFKKFLKEARKNGHLIMPYTNNTWWCDAPKGPTFKAYSDVALCRDINGNFYREKYGNSTGFTTCLWTKASLEATANIMNGFTKDYPVDIVFQDQTGSRSASRVDTNPEAPTRNSYLDGLIYSTKIDSQKIPLSTEDGWSHIVDYEIQFCGFSFGFIEPCLRKDWKYIWQTYPKDSVEITNIAGAMFQDKVSLTQHNIGGVTKGNRTITCSLLHGLHLMTDMHMGRKEADLEFIKWISTLQDKVASEYIGTSMKSFESKWVDIKSSDGNRIGNAQYGKLAIIANLNDTPYEFEKFKIAPDGFFAKSNKVIAGNILAIEDEKVDTPSNFILYEQDENLSLEVFGNGGKTVIIPRNKKIDSLIYNNAEIPFESIENGIKFTLPKTEVNYPILFKFIVKTH